MSKNLNPSYIIADHIRASCFIIASGVMPSGKQRGYILRRLIRRSLSASLRLNIDINNAKYFKNLVQRVVEIYQDTYPELEQNQEKITEILLLESQKYTKAITVGKKEWEKFLSKHQA